jgi:Na+-driven multidrug efflux pump
MSYAVSLTVMVVLDFILIPPFHVVGAAVAALVSQLVGSLVALAFYLRWEWDARGFIPRPRDVVYLVQTVMELVRRR